MGRLGILVFLWGFLTILGGALAVQVLSASAVQAALRRNKGEEGRRQATRQGNCSVSGIEMAGWGECMRRHPALSGMTDGCQEFASKEADPDFCKVCNCSKGFHAKPRAAEQAASAQTGSAIKAGKEQHVEVTAGGEKSFAAKGEEPCEIIEQPAKKARVSEAGDNSKPEAPVPAKDTCAQVTRRSFAALQKEFPAEKYGNYKLCLNDSTMQWELWCEPCQSWNKVNKTNLTVSNFRAHLKGDKHEQCFKGQREREARAEEKVAKEQKETREKREELIARYEKEGKLFQQSNASTLLKLLLTSEVLFMCSFCDSVLACSSYSKSSMYLQAKRRRAALC